MNRSISTLTRAVRIIDGESVYEAYPANELTLDVTIEFPHPIIGRQSRRYVVGRGMYREGAGRERERSASFTKSRHCGRKGLIQGASTDNAVVLDDTDVVDDELRWNDEFVRHKATGLRGRSRAGRRARARANSRGAGRVTGAR